MIQIRQASMDEWLMMVDLDESVIGHRKRAPYIKEAVQTGNGYIAKDHTLCVGFGLIKNMFLEHPFISLLIVHHAYRRRGVGRSLMLAMEKNVSGGKLFTSTNASNTPMQKLCESLGYIKSGWIENLEEGDPEIIYFKKLK